MTKVEAVVIRERVETVIDAVEAETGHVGVTVVEAIGHGRQRGVTHEYRGRVFESRFLPKALLTFVVEDSLASGVVENSVYVDERARGGGVGRLLLERLVASTEAAGIWTIQTGVFPENEPSLRLHEWAGFEVVGRRKRLGKLHGVWRDVLLLERRSDLVE